MLGGIRFAISQHLNVHTIFSNLGALSLHQWQLIGSLGLHRKNSNISLPHQAFWNRSKSIKILQVSMVFPMVFRVMVPLFIPLPENTSPLIRRWIHRDWFSAKICRSSFWWSLIILVPTTFGKKQRAIQYLDNSSHSWVLLYFRLCLCFSPIVWEDFGQPDSSIFGGALDLEQHDMCWVYWVIRHFNLSDLDCSNMEDSMRSSTWNHLHNDV